MLSTWFLRHEFHEINGSQELGISPSVSLELKIEFTKLKDIIVTVNIMLCFSIYVNILKI